MKQMSTIMKVYTYQQRQQIIVRNQYLKGKKNLKLNQTAKQTKKM